MQSAWILNYSKWVNTPPAFYVLQASKLTEYDYI